MDLKHADDPATSGSLQLEPGPTVRLAGTFYHQDTLRPAAPRIPDGASSAVRRVAVRLRHDPCSAHAGAVAVEHGGRLIGHLPRAWAPLFHEVLSACEDKGQVVTATAVLRCSLEDPYVSVDVEALPPGADPYVPDGGPGAAQSGSSVRASRRRARSRAGWPFGTVLACVVAAATAVVGPAAAAELVTLVSSTTPTSGGGGGSAQNSAL